MKRKQLDKITVCSLFMCIISSVIPVNDSFNILLNKIGIGLEQVIADTIVVSTTTINNVVYNTMSDDTVQVGESQNATGDINIESEVNSLPVTSIGANAFYYCDEITSINIPDTVTRIGSTSFAYCTALKSVILPNSLTTLEDSVFKACISLKTISIPSSVTSIGDYAFYSCKVLGSIEIPNSVTYIGEYAFAGCQKSDSLLIPDSVNYIGDTAFANCKNLTEVVIPNSVTYMGELMFAQCTKLVSVTLPNSITQINHKIFQGCTMLTNVTIPDSVNYIGMSAFENCTSLAEINIPNSVTKLDKYVFRNSELLTRLELPDSVTFLGFGALGNISIVKASKEIVDAETARIRVYFYDKEGTECIASYSVLSGTNLEEEAKNIGTGWTKESGSELGSVKSTSKFLLSGELVKPEQTTITAPTITASKVKAGNREVGVTISLK